MREELLPFLYASFHSYFGTLFSRDQYCKKCRSILKDKGTTLLFLAPTPPSCCRCTMDQQFVMAFSELLEFDVLRWTTCINAEIIANRSNRPMKSKFSFHLYLWCVLILKSAILWICFPPCNDDFIKITEVK